MAILSGGRVHAQNSLGIIQGSISDSKGYKVSGAEVDITNLDTGVAIKTKTNETGFYTVPSLLPGSHYAISVTLKGFQTLQVSSVEVSSGETTTLDQTLTVGREDVSVIVKANDQMVTPDSPMVATTMGQDLIENLPFPEQGTLEVALLAPGVRGSQQGGQGVASENPNTYTGNVEPGAEITINGASPGHSAQLVDGSDVTQNGYSRAGITVSSNMVGQVTVISNGVPAQYGRTMGGVVISSTRSGTNQYHGTLGWRHTDPFFEASLPAAGFVVPPDNHQNFFSAVIGGPVIIPHVYNGRQKTFFFFGYEPARLKAVLSQPYNVPIPDWPDAATCTPTSAATIAAGNGGTCGEVSGHFWNDINLNPFSSYTAGAANPYAGYNPPGMSTGAFRHLGDIWYQSALNASGLPTGPIYTSTASATSPGYRMVPNDDLSAQLALNPFAKFVLSQYPTIGTPGNVHYRIGADGIPGHYDKNGVNADVLRGVINHDNRYALRIDHNIGSNDRMYARFSRTPLSAVRYSAFAIDSELSPYPTDYSLANNFVIDETHVFGNSGIINEAKGGLLINHQLRTPNPTAESKDWGASFGLTQAGAGKGFPSLNLGSSIFGVGQAQSANNIDQTVQAQDDITLVRGRHTLHTGIDLRRLQSNQVTLAGYYGGQYGFGPGQTDGPSSTNSGVGTASFVLGLISSYSYQPQSIPAHYRWQYYATYIQDDFRIRSNLTLNLGVRYEIETPRKEINDLQGTFVPASSGFLNGQSATGAFCFSGACGLPHTLWPMNYKGVQPRVGFAWAVKPRFVLRGSYAILRVPLTGLGVTPIPNFSVNSQQIGGLLGGTNPNQPVDYLTNPIVGGQPSAYNYFQGSRGPFFTVPSGIAIPYIAQVKTVPYSQQWSLTTQFQILRRTLIETGYNGARGIHLFNNSNGPQNFPNLNTVLSNIASGTCFSGCYTGAPGSATNNPYGFQTNGAYTNEDFSQTLLPYQNFYNQTGSGTAAEIGELDNRTGVSSYHAAFISGTHRFDRGLAMQASFTWSKAIDDTGSDAAASLNSGHNTPLQNPFNRNGEKAVSDYDVPARFIAGYTYQIPFGKAQAHKLSTTGPFFLRLPAIAINNVFGDFVTGGIFRAESGNPFQPTLGVSGNNASGSTDTANSPGYWFSNPTAAEPYGTSALPVGLTPRPDIVPGVPCINSYWNNARTNKLNLSYINILAFSIPGSIGAPQFGNAPRTMANCRSPRIIIFDANLSKRIPVGKDGKKYLQFTVVAINAPNHPQFVYTGTSTNGTQGNQGKMYSSYTQNLNAKPNAQGIYPCLQATATQADGTSTPQYAAPKCGFTPGQYFGEPNVTSNARYLLLGLSFNF